MFYDNMGALFTMFKRDTGGGSRFLRSLANNRILHGRSMRSSLQRVLNSIPCCLRCGVIFSIRLS